LIVAGSNTAPGEVEAVTVLLTVTPPTDAVRVMVDWQPMKLVTLKLALVEPAGAVTRAGTDRASGLEALRVTTVGVVGGVGLRPAKSTVPNNVSPGEALTAGLLMIAPGIWAWSSVIVTGGGGEGGGGGAAGGAG
jgi:hypothetical protein